MKENNKVGLVTFYKDNFGSILQCYATKVMIERAGFKCIVISQNEDKKEKNGKIKKKLTNLQNLIVNCYSDPTYFARWKRTRRTPVALTLETIEKMNMFVENEIKPKIYSWNDLTQIGYSDEFRFFISGSDQIWNAYNKISPLYFLKFCSDEKKLAFAVSFGVNNPSKFFLDRIKRGIIGYDSISVREKSGIDIIKKISNVEITCIGDPVFMLDKNEWSEFSKNQICISEDYILIHFLDCPNDLAINKIISIQSESKLKVICIAYHYVLFEKLNWEFMDCGPREYIAYINRAKYVFTDSYHTTLFSINLGINFFTFERQYLHGHPQSERIIDLLRRFDVLDRYINTEKTLPKTEVMGLQKLVLQEKEYIIKYLYGKLGVMNERKELLS